MRIIAHFDKLAHFSAYCILGLLTCALNFQISPKLSIPLLSTPLLFSSAVGSGEEIYQMFIPGRQASILDLIADIAGAACAIILANRIAKIRRKKYNATE
jgi:VanZ family protein